jgi:hypothetical protein
VELLRQLFLQCEVPNFIAEQFHYSTIHMYKPVIGTFQASLA